MYMLCMAGAWYWRGQCPRDGLTGHWLQHHYCQPICH